MKVKVGPKVYKITTHDVVTALAFSPYDWCGSLLAVGTESRITIFNCVFPEEDPTLTDMECTSVRDFYHGCRVLAVSWSPQTSLKQLPKELRFVTAGGDMKLRYFFSDLKNDKVLHIEGHTDHINDVAVEPRTGEAIASVSDDCTCQIFNIDGDLKSNFILTSPGMSVSWHRSEPDKLMVGEKKGLIRFYNLKSEQPVMSLDCSGIPLLSAKWCPSNSSIVGCAAGVEWFLWKTTGSSQPIEHKIAHGDGAASFSFSQISQNIFATRNSSGTEIKVMNPKISQPILMQQLTLGNGITWHFKLQMLAVGGDCKVHLWKVNCT